LRQESEGLTRNLIHELREVQTREQLRIKSKVLKSYFNAMAGLVIAVEEKTTAEHSVLCIDGELSAALREELSRLYRLAGGREEVEAAQKEALHKLQGLRARKTIKSRDWTSGHSQKFVSLGLRESLAVERS
jgi:hypothetical protein